MVHFQSCIRSLSLSYPSKMEDASPELIYCRFRVAGPKGMLWFLPWVIFIWRILCHKLLSLLLRNFYLVNIKRRWRRKCAYIVFKLKGAKWLCDVDWSAWDFMRKTQADVTMWVCIKHLEFLKFVSEHRSCMPEHGSNKGVLGKHVRTGSITVQTHLCYFYTH